MIWLLIYAVGYLFTFKKVFAFLWKDINPLGPDSLDLAFIIFASFCFTLLWPVVWAGLAVNEYALKPLLAELERKKNASV